MHYGISAAGALVKHLNENCAISISHISKLSPIVDEGFMVLILLLSKTWKSLIRLIHKVFTVHSLILST